MNEWGETTHSYHLNTTDSLEFEEICIRYKERKGSEDHQRNQERRRFLADVIEYGLSPIKNGITENVRLKIGRSEETE